MIRQPTTKPPKDPVLYWLMAYTGVSVAGFLAVKMNTDFGLLVMAVGIIIMGNAGRTIGRGICFSIFLYYIVNMVLAGGYVWLTK
ncbi:MULTISPECIES: hypothetical protein [Aeromonas]|uniref:hypothetical protein n=1 Tax=Aeromonas TaxID=642 RepID=UPI0005B4E668|nr:MULTISPECIES: hypothetical protein [Aeromonas]TNH76505.1 hypothetical protein CF142_04335 [Aeromonas caviae]